MGHLHALWHAALEQQEDGDLSSWSDELIAEMASFPGDAPQFVRLLQKHNWLDGKLLHDWHDYAGKYLHAKYHTANPGKLKEIKERYQSALSLTKVSLKSTTLPDLPDQQNNSLSGSEKTGPDGPRSNGSLKNEALEILSFLNQKAVKHFEPTETNLGFIISRLRKSTPAKCRQVIALKCRQWMGDPERREYLRPATLFNKTKFDQYVGELLIHVDDNGVS